MPLSIATAGPHRRLDTRIWPYGKLGYGDIAWLYADFGIETNPHIKAWVVNVTATDVSTHGYLTAGLRLAPITPTRIVDSRSGLGTPGALGQAETATIAAPAQVLGEETRGLALNVTAVQPTGNTFMTVWPNSIAQPVVSNLNPSVGQIVPNAVVTGVDATNKFNVYNDAGRTNLIVDVVGRYYWYTYVDTIAGAQAGPVMPTRGSISNPAPVEARLHSSR